MLSCLRPGDAAWSLLLVFHFLSALSGGYGCNVTIHPSGTKVLLVNQSINNVTCQADGCVNATHLQFFNSVLGHPTDIGLCSTQNSLQIITCNATVTMRDDGTILICGVVRNGGNKYSNNQLKLLVQGVLHQVGSVTVSQLSTAFLNISWSPVYAYEGLIVSYNISFNGTYNTQSNTWTKFNTSIIDIRQCDYTSLSITPFINATDQTLFGNVSQWNISNYNMLIINKTMIMYKNGTVVSNLVIDTCSCEEPVSSHVTLKNKAIFYSVTLPITPISNCSGNASLIIPPYMSIEVEVWLICSDGLTIQMGNITFDSSPLDIAFINGTPPSIQCTFTNDVMITNHHLAGCLVYYANMSHPMYAMRDNDESNVTIDITDINSIGYYNISVIPLAFPFQHLNSVYINANTIKPTITMTSSTAQHSSSTYTSLSFSVSPSTLSNGTKICMSFKVMIPVVILIFVALILIIIILGICCIKYYRKSRNVKRDPQPTHMTSYAEITPDNTDSEGQNNQEGISELVHEYQLPEVVATNEENNNSSAIVVVDPLNQPPVTVPSNDKEGVQQSTNPSSAKSEDLLLNH